MDYAILPHLEATKSTSATQATSLDFGRPIIIAGAAMPGRAIDLTICVLSPTEKMIRLKKGVRCNAEPVAVMERANEVCLL